jgi:hypothetical protein
MSTFNLSAVQAHVKEDYSNLVEDSFIRFCSIAEAEELVLVDTIFSEFCEHAKSGAKRPDRFPEILRRVLG